MNITTKYQTHPTSGRSQILARGLGGRQKTTSYDDALSMAQNHGRAAAALIEHVQRTAPELQYGDDICANAVRSIDAGNSTHTMNDSGSVHKFSI